MLRSPIVQEYGEARSGASWFLMLGSRELLLAREWIAKGDGGVASIRYSCCGGSHVRILCCTGQGAACDCGCQSGFGIITNLQGQVEADSGLGICAPCQGSHWQGLGWAR